MTWTQRDILRGWRSIASSADGSKLAAGLEGGAFFTSPGLVTPYNLSLLEDAGAQSVANFATSISAGPANESGQTVNFTVSNNNNGLFSSPPAISSTGTLTFTPTANASGSATVTVALTDNGGTNPGVNTSAAQTFTITVAAVNDPPVNTVPGSQTVVEDTSLAFTGVNLISVQDVDGSVTRTQLSVSHGTLTVSLAGGATISAGANGSAALTLVGTKAQVNVALATLSYQPVSNYSGNEALTVLTINDLTGPPFGVGAEYGPVAGFSYSGDPILGDSRTPDKAFDGTTTDSHSAAFSPSVSNPFYFKITAPNPITVTSYYISGRGSNDHKPSSWTFEGSNDDSNWTILDSRSGINLTFGTIVTSAMSPFAVSNSLPYKYYRFAITSTTGSYIVIGEMALVGSSALSAINTIPITVTAVNDAPTLATIPVTGTEDTTLAFTSANFTGAYSDIENTALVSITVVTLPATGTLKLSAAAVTVNQVIAAANLGNLTYEPAANENGAKTFTVTASDGGLSSAAATVTMTLAAVNDAPTLAAIAVTGTEDTTLAFTSANFTGAYSDVENTALATITVVTLPATGTLKLSGTAVTVNQVIAAANLGALTYEPAANENGAKTFTVTASDGGLSSAAATVSMTLTAVNDAPVFATLNGTPSFTENGSAVQLDSDATVADAELDAANNYNGATLTLARQTTPNTDDVFGFATGTVTVSGSNLQISSVTKATFTQTAGTLTVTFNGSATSADANAILQSITYLNISKAPPSSVVVLYAFNDGNTASAQGSGGALSATGILTVTITAVNDAPTVSGFAPVAGVDSFSTVGAATWSVPSGVTSVEVLVVAGGGAGGADVGGGGGGGQVISSSSVSVTGGQTASITIGAGGARGAAYNQYGLKGGDSSFAIGATTLTAVGGSGGAGRGPSYAGGIGFNGGGGSFDFAAATSFSGGNAGGASVGGGTGANGNGGGGGAGGAGVAGLNSKAGDGGPGVSSSISGTLTSYGGGGGGSFYNINSSTVNGLGVDGGGNGGYGNVFGVDGVAGRGGGGGGGPSTSSSGNNGVGGSGIVILRYSSAAVFTVTEDLPGNLLFTGTPFADVDSTSLTVTLTVSDGTITGNAGTGVTVGGTATARTFVGTVNALNAYFTTAGKITYQGAANNTTSRTLTITLSDGMLSSSETATISFTAVNDAPVITANTGLTVLEGDSGAIGAAELAVTDVDNTAGQMVFTLVTAPAHGALKKNGTVLTTGQTFTQTDLSTGFTITYQHDGSEPSGSPNDQFNFSVSDGSGGSIASTQFHITVTPVNDPPVNDVSNPQSALSVSEDTALVFSTANNNVISVSDPDAGSNPVKVSLNVSHGSLTLSGIANLTFTTGDGTADSFMEFTGTLTAINTALLGMSYSPPPNYNGPSTLTITSNDQGNSGIATSGGPLSDFDSLDITVTAVNDAPVLNASASPVLDVMFEDAPAPVGPVGTPIGFGGLIDQFGTLSNVSDGDAGAQSGVAIIGTSGDGTWHYTINNGTSWQLMGTVSDASARLLAADGQTRIYFQPNANFNGTIASALTFRAWDRTTGNNGASAVNTSGSNSGTTTAFSVATDTASITITEINDPPVAVNDIKTIGEDGTLSFLANDLLANDLKGPAGATGEAGQTLTVIGLSPTADTHGTVSLIAGTITYVPAPDFNGPASFTYTVQDNGTTSGFPDSRQATALVNVTVTSVNDAPIAVADFKSTPEDTALTFAASQLMSNDAAGPGSATDETGQTFSVISVTGGAGTHGTVTLSGVNITYTPALNYNGPASFSYTIRDNGTSNGAPDAKEANGIVNVTVTSINDPPTITGISNQTIEEDHSTAAIVFTIDDPENPPVNLNVSVFVDAAGGFLLPPGSIALSGSGAERTITVTPAQNQFGQATVTVTVTDQDGAAASTSFVVTVTSVIDGTPVVADAITEYKVQTTGNLRIERNPADGPEVTHFQITDILGGKLYRQDGTTEIGNGQFILVGDAAVGLKFTPDVVGTSSFKARASSSSLIGGLGGTAATARITVSKAHQTITFAAPPPVDFHDGLQVTLGATASSGLAVTYEAFGSATLNGNTLTVLGAGDFVLFALQAGDANYLAASPVVQLLSVARAPQAITFNLGTGVNQIYGNPPLALNATASSGRPIRYSVSGPGFKDANNQLVITGAGAIFVLAEQDGDATFLPAQPVTRTITVSKTDLTVRVRSATRFVGAPNPVFATDPITELKNGDTVGVHFFTSASPQSALGEYDIFADLEDPETRLVNYTVHLITGKLTVLEKPAPILETVNIPADEDTPKVIAIVGTLDLSRSGSSLKNTALVTLPLKGVFQELPGGATAPASQGTLFNVTYKPALDINGADSFSVLYEYVSGVSVLRTFQINIGPGNDPPRLDPIPDIAIKETTPQITVPLHGIAAGPANETQPISISAVSDAPSIIQVLTVGAGPVSPGSDSFLILSRVATAGKAKITVTVSDGEAVNGTFIREFNVEISPRAIKVADGAGMPGMEINLPITLIASGNENAVGLTLSFDSGALQVVSVLPGANLPAGAAFQGNQQDANTGRVSIAIALSANAQFAAGSQVLAVVKVRLADLAPAEIERILEIGFATEPVHPRVSDALTAFLPATFDHSNIKVTRGFEADLTAPFGNTVGAVTVTDWVRVGLLYIGLEDIVDASEFQRADSAPRQTLGDGNLDLDDWVQAGRYQAAFDLPVPRAGGPLHSPVITTASLNGGSGSGVAKKSTTGSGVRKVTLAKKAAAAGDTVVIVSLAAQGNENAIGFSLGFDPQMLKFKTARLGTDAPGGFLLTNARFVSDGRVGLALAMPAGQSLPVGERSLIEVEFTNLTTAPPTAAEIIFSDTPVARGVSSAGADKLPAVYVNGLRSSEAAAAEPAIAVNSSSRTKSGEMVLRLNGNPGETYVIETSEDLSTWKVFKQVILDDSNSEVVDAEAKRLAGRFYRIKRAP